MYEKEKLRWEEEGQFSFIKNNSKWLEVMYSIMGYTKGEPPNQSLH